MMSCGLLSQKKLFDQYLGKSDRPLSCYHFSSVFAWKEFFEFSFDVVHDRLCVFAAHQGGRFLYLPPLGGDLDLSTVQECFKRMGKSKLARVENISDNQLPAFNGRAYNTCLKSNEYVYAREDLETLSGSRYKSKRHDVHLFRKKHPGAALRPYVPADMKGCGALYRRWANTRRRQNSDPVFLAMLEDNEAVHALLLANITPLELVARVVDVDEEIAGYTLGYAVDDQTFCVALEITDLDKKGLGAYIFNAFCTDEEVRPFAWINTMDDFGMPGVAESKNSYHPMKRLAVYSVTQGA